MRATIDEKNKTLELLESCTYEELTAFIESKNLKDYTIRFHDKKFWEAVPIQPLPLPTTISNPYIQKFWYGGPSEPLRVTCSNSTQPVLQ